MLKSQVESILFVVGKTLTLKELAKLCGRSKNEIEVVLEDLKNKYNNEESGINILMTDKEVQMVIKAENAPIVESLVKEEITSELTQPQLEALTIIAYRGPITKLALEQIRGVNCSLILRNLVIKGLIEVTEDNIILPARASQWQAGENNTYQISPKLMQHLGINSIEELPEYGKLSKIEDLEEQLAASS